VLIIEGADELGKTTAAKRLVELAAEDGKYPIRYAHMSRPNSTFDFFNDYSDMFSLFAVQDRFHIGGMVWHKNAISTSALRIIEGRLYTLGSVVVVMHTSDKDWYDAALSKGKPQSFSTNDIVTANDMFCALSQNNVVSSDFIYDVKDGKYPSDDTLSMWLDCWYSRLKLLVDPRK